MRSASQHAPWGDAERIFIVFLDVKIRIVFSSTLLYEETTKIFTSRKAMKMRSASPYGA